MTDAPKRRGRPAKAPSVEVIAAKSGLRVKKADAIHDGKGGFLAVGAVFEPADADAGEALKAKGFAE